MITKFVVILFLVDFALAQTTKTTLSSETNERNAFNSEVPKNQQPDSIFNAEKSPQSNLAQLSSLAEDSITGIDETPANISTQKSSIENLYDTRFPSTYASPTSAEAGLYGLDKNTTRKDSSGVEKLQDSSSKSDDPKNEFIRFVQTALKKFLSMPQYPVKQPISPSVVRKLSDITRPLRKQTVIQKTISEKPLYRTSLAKNLNSEDVSRHPEDYGPIYNEEREEFNRNSPKSSYEDISPSPLSSFLSSTFDYQNKNKQNPPNEESRHRFRSTQKVPHSRPLSSYYNATRTSSQRNLGQFQGNFRRGIQSHRNKNRNNPTYSDERTREYRVHPFTNMLQTQVKSSTIEKTEEELDHIESKSQAENARYSFSSDVQDDINGNLHQRQETRDGTKVTGSYTYEDGFFRRTVHYVADEKGYRVVKQEVDEIGDGPLYNPYGSAKIRSYVAGKNLNYRITARDQIERPQVPNEQPKYELDSGYQWEYQ